MLHRLHSAITLIENAPLTLRDWVLSFAAIVAVRLALENFFTDFPFSFADHYFYFFTDFFFSFGFSLLIIVLVLRWASRVSFPQAANIGLVALLVIWTPPIIDEILSKGQGFWSFYCFDSLAGLWERYLHFFGKNPEVGITYGVRVEVGLAVVFAFGYTLLKRQSWLRALSAALFLYTALFAILALPSLIGIPLLGSERGLWQIKETDIAAFMLTPSQLFGLPAPSIASVLNIKVTLLFVPLLTLLIGYITWYFFRSLFWALIHNARIPQIIYHVGLFLTGGSLVFLYGKPVFEFDLFHLAALFGMLVSIIFAWLSSVITNDLYDVPIDKLTNPDRPLITHSIDRETYITLGLLFFFASVLLMAIVSTQAAMLILIYHAITHLYSANPLRLKRFPLIATVLAATASLTVFFAGYIVFSADKNISTLPWSIPALLFLAYTFLLPIKDFKDILGDRSDSVFTLPVLLGETWAKRFIGSMLLIMFMASVFVLDIPHLFLLAFFFGSLAYWILQISTPTHRYFSYRKLAHWYIVLVSAYASLLAYHFLSR